MGLAFGDGLHNAATTLLESLAVPFRKQRERYTDQWNRSCRRILPLEKAASDGGDLYHGSYSLLLAHEDKTYPGAFIASLSIPWGSPRATTTVGDITSYGRGTWSTRPRASSPRGTPRRRCVH